MAWVSRAMSGSATLRDAIAATTAASARQTTAVITPWRGESVWVCSFIIW